MIPTRRQFPEVFQIQTEFSPEKAGQNAANFARHHRNHPRHEFVPVEVQSYAYLTLAIAMRTRSSNAVLPSSAAMCSAIALMVATISRRCSSKNFAFTKPS